MNKSISKTISLIIVLLLAYSCSTQKNTFVSRNFHSITTKYNGYFNAHESYRAGLKRLDEVHEDNYEDMLSVFRYGSTQQASGVAGNMDVAYQKASTAIRRHSMNIKGVEYNRWIDDSYYLIARSHYFKGDHNLSILTFQYIIRQFDTPLKYKSKIWVAKNHIKAGQYNNAVQILERVSKNIEEGLLDNSAVLLYNMVSADLHLQQRNFAQSIPYLEKATILADKRKLRTRLTYILAQAYHKEQNFQMAQKTYARVLKLNPDFQMAFQARINMAMAFDVRSGDSNFILSELTGMLRDNKNREFRDQIYYALGQFSMRQNKEKEAINYYNLALENFKDNKSQKGITFLRLAEIKFDNKDYIAAADLYDSTMVYLSQEYPEFTQAGQKNAVLKELAVNLRRIEREDSLQRLALMTNDQRNAVIDMIIADLEEQERLEREREQERAQMRQQMARSGRGQTPGANEGGWYFYNPSAINFGKNEFYAKWGERKLEDLWRISNKRVIAFGDPDAPDALTGEEEAETGRMTRASLLNNIPLTAEKIEQSNDRIAQSLYNSAVIFKDRLSDTPNAINNFESLIQRYPNHEKKLLSLYFLQGLYDQAGNSARANVYKSMIINDFPDTDFAMILSDPDYRKNLIDRQNRVKELYERAYQAFVSKDYDRAMYLSLQSQADSLEISRDEAAQFSFLKALIFARTDQQQELMQQLTYVTENYTQTMVHEPATNLLAFLGSQGLQYIASNDEQSDVSRIDVTNESMASLSPESLIFSFKPDAVHFFVMVVNTRSLQIRQIRAEINNFNRDHFGASNLNMSTLFFDQNRQLITITNFADAITAKNYGNQMTTEMINKGYDPEAFNAFAISVDNYPVFYQERKLTEYLDFFNYYYPRLK